MLFGQKIDFSREFSNSWIAVALLATCATILISPKIMSENVPQCPDCQDYRHLIRIVYGRPSQSTVDEAQKGLIKLGSCCPAPEKWYCSKCQKNILPRPVLPKTNL